MAEEVAKAESDAAAKDAADRKAGIQRRLELQTMMVAKAHMKAAELDEKLAEGEATKRVEDQFKAKVNQTLSSTDPPVWHGRRKFDW